jgi:CRISPR-associated protein Cas6
MTVKDAEVRLFSPLPTLFARYVITEADQDEAAFLQSQAAQLKRMGISVRKLMAGKPNVFNMPEGPVHTRSLMVADLSPEESVRLQQQGVGEGRTFGCGIFIPQKGIKAVKPDGE